MNGKRTYGRRSLVVIGLWLLGGASVSAGEPWKVVLNGAPSNRNLYPGGSVVYEAVVSGDAAYKDEVKVRFSLSTDAGTFRAPIVVKAIPQWTCKTTPTSALCEVNWENVSQPELSQYWPQFRTLRFTQATDSNWCGKRINAAVNVKARTGKPASASASTQLHPGQDPSVWGRFLSAQVAPGSELVAQVGRLAGDVYVPIPANTTYVGYERSAQLSNFWNLTCSPRPNLIACYAQLRNCLEGPHALPQAICMGIAESGWTANVKFKVNENTPPGTILTSNANLGPVSSANCGDSSPSNNSIRMSATVSP